MWWGGGDYFGKFVFRPTNSDTGSLSMPLGSSVRNKNKLLTLIDIYELSLWSLIHLIFNLAMAGFAFVLTNIMCHIVICCRLFKRFFFIFNQQSQRPSHFEINLRNTCRALFVWNHSKIPKFFLAFIRIAMTALSTSPRMIKQIPSTVLNVDW